ncbi:MAG TPA: protein-glutamate O-methyltransferase CheR [Terriglobia bacterium]|nr:protein-glutamate O-methyltransferase CheR [Terriglobia bacterium]
MAITRPDFEFIRDLVRVKAGIVLDPGKEYLVESRLAPLARKEGLPSLSALVAGLRSRSPNSLHYKVIEAMTTNETTFFRDHKPFELLRTKVLPEVVSRRGAGRRISIWCAASSSGQEPYSIAMLLREHFPFLATWRVDFIASDISQEMLARTRQGRYSQLEVNRGLPATYLVKYFRKEGAEWQVLDDLRRMLSLREINLAEAWPHLPTLDIVFMRNVLIYFSVESKKEILARVRKLLRVDGYLFLGGAETTLNLDDNFEAVPGLSTCYRLKEAVTQPN